MEPDNPLLDDHVLDLARAERGRERPRVCFLATASGDSPAYIASFYAAFARRAEASHLALFIRTVDDIESFLLDQDVIYVGGGNTENMLAIWRVHGVDRALGRAWESGVVLTGLSAGSLCWFETGTTDSFGRAGAAVARARVPARQPCAALRRRGDATPALPAAGRRRARCRRGMPPTTAPRSSSTAPSWPRSSRRDRTRAAYRVERGPAGDGRRDGAADALPGLRLRRTAAGATGDALGSQAPIARTASGPSLPLPPAAGGLDRLCPSRAARAAGRGRPAARARTGAIAAAGCGTSRSLGGLRRVGLRIDASVPPAGARWRRERARRRAGRDRARAGPSARASGGRTSRSRALSADEQGERAASPGPGRPGRRGRRPRCGTRAGR